MKNIVFCCLFVIAGSVHAQSLEANDALASLLEYKIYMGKSPEGKACAVTIYKDQTATKVVATQAPLRLVKFVENNSEYQWQPGQRYFLSTSHIQHRNGDVVEKTFMTRMITENRQYMVVEHLTTRGQERLQEVVQCEVDL